MVVMLSLSMWFSLLAGSVCPSDGLASVLPMWRGKKLLCLYSKIQGDGWHTVYLSHSAPQGAFSHISGSGTVWYLEG
jgi:hypothetical protein